MNLPRLALSVLPMRHSSTPAPHCRALVRSEPSRRYGVPPGLLRSPLLQLLFSRWMHRHCLSEWYRFSDVLFLEFCGTFQATVQDVIGYAASAMWPSFLSIHWANVLFRTFGVAHQYGPQSLLSPFSLSQHPTSADRPGVLLPLHTTSAATTHSAIEAAYASVWSTLATLTRNDQRRPIPSCVFAAPHTYQAEYIQHRLASASQVPAQNQPHITLLTSAIPLSALVSRLAGPDSQVRLWMLSTSSSPPALSPYAAIRFRNVFAPALRRYKAFPCRSEPVLQGDVGTQGRALCEAEFSRIWAAEVTVRRDALSPCWDPRRRVITRRRRKWELVEQSWDRVNSALDYSTAKHIRKIADLRLTNVSVSQLGSFVYVAWVKGDGRVYIGQTGGRSKRRSVGQRGREHVRTGMDLVRLRHGQKIHVPSDLYQLLRRVGVENLVITPLESVPPHKLDEREMWWIRKWGLGQVLNRQLPSLKSEKWSFLYRRKVWERELQERGGSVLSLAREIIASPRTLNTPGAYPPPLQLLVVSATARLLSASEHRRLFDAVRQWFIIHHKVVLPYRVPFRVPLLQASAKPTVLAKITEVFRAAHFWPAPLQDFLLSRVKVISGKTPKVKNLLISSKPPDACTDVLFQPHPQVAYVHGHAVFRDPNVLTSLHRRLSLAVFGQNLKNSTVPPWPRIYADNKKSVYKFAETLPDHRAAVFDQLILPITRALEFEYQAISSATPRHLHSSFITRQRRLLPPFLKVMFFDKANEVIDFGCHFFWKIVHAQLLYGSPRFREVARFSSSTDANFFLFWRTMDGFCLSQLGTYFALSRLKGLSALHPDEALRAFGIFQRHKKSTMYHNQCKLVETRAIHQLKRSYPQWDRLALPTAHLFPTLTAAHLRKRTSPDPSSLPTFLPTPPLPYGSAFFIHVSEEPPAQPAYHYPSRLLPEPKQPLGVPDVLPVRKFKSKEFAVPQVVKFREIVRHAASPVKITAKFVSRALTVLWKLAVTHCPAFEFVGLESFVDRVREWRTRGYTGTPTELDLVEMFPNVPRDDIPVAIQFFYDRVTEALNLGPTASFNLHRDNLRALDFFGAKSKNPSFVSFSLSDVLSYMGFELLCNDAFAFYSSIFRQTTGTAIGGSLSAQFASMVVMYRERDLHADPFFQDIPLCRYRDNYGTLSPSAEFLSSLCTRLATALGMQVTVETQGT